MDFTKEYKKISYHLDKVKRSFCFHLFGKTPSTHIANKNSYPRELRRRATRTA
jgi:hypothetical protein